MQVNEKEIKKIKNIDVLDDCYNEFLMKFSCKPNRDEYPYPKIGTVLDEDKSVKWNREEVDRLRAEYTKQATQLNKTYNHINNVYEKQMIALLAKANKLSFEESEKIWQYAYEDNHSCGLYAVRDAYSQLVDLYNDLLKVRENNGI